MHVYPRVCTKDARHGMPRCGITLLQALQYALTHTFGHNSTAWLPHKRINMAKGKVFLIGLITALLGFAGGYFFYANTVARYDAMSSVCVAMQEAVRNQMLTPQEVRALGVVTGSTLKRQYSSVASKLSMPKEGVQNASPDSMCSQFLVGVHQSP